MVQLGDKSYFVLSVYFIDTRILLDMITESESNSNLDINYRIPSTLEENLLMRFKREQNRKSGCFELLVNGEKHSLIGGSQGNLNQRSIKIKDKLPEEFAEKQLDFIKYEFTQLEEETEIKEVSVVKKIDVKEYLIQQKHTVPIDIGSEPFIFTYKDGETNNDCSLIIKELFYEDITEDRTALFNCKDNEKMLWGLISADKDIRDLDIFTEKRLKGGINYTMSPIIPIGRVTNTNNENLIDHKLYLGFVDPEQREVDVELFIIRKKIDNKYEAKIYQQNKI